jgi:hypothetical protein
VCVCVCLIVCTNFIYLYVLEVCGRGGARGGSSGARRGGSGGGGKGGEFELKQGGVICLKPGFAHQLPMLLNSVSPPVTCVTL